MSTELKEINKKEMGGRIRARREALHISREELGKLLGVTGKFISDIEYGDKGVSLKNLYKMKQILGVTTDYILEGNPAGMDDNEKRRQLSENILGSLSVCSVEQLGCMEKIAGLYVEGIVYKD